MTFFANHCILADSMNDLDYISIIGNYSPERSNILRILHELQNAHPQHYLPEDALLEVSRYLKLTKAAVYGVATYYTMFSTTPRGRFIIRVCRSPICHMMGSGDIVGALTRHLGIDMGQTSVDGLFTLEYCECLGMCQDAPSLMINERVHSGLTHESVVALLEHYRIAEK